MNKGYCYLLVIAVLFFSCKKEKKGIIAGPSTWEETIEMHIDTSVRVYGNYAAVKLPITKGVEIWNPAAIAIDSLGVIYGSNYTGEIYSLIDSDKDGLEDTAQLFCDVGDDGLRYPTSIIFRNSKLFVATTQEIRVYEDTDGDGRSDNSYTFFDDFPYTMHPFDWTFALEFDSEGYLYAILCTDSWNDDPAPDPEGLRGSILKIDPDGKSYERIATGLRFAYGMRFNEHGDLFFSDNRGNENKYEELNLVVKDGFYGNNQPKYPNHPPIKDPIIKLEYGFAPTGIRFNSKNNDFGDTAGNLFIAFFGPDGQWEDGSLSRVKLTKSTVDGSYAVKEFPVADKIAKLSDLVFGKNGDLYLAQFGIEGTFHKPYKKPMGSYYRFIHAPWVVPDNLDNNTSVVFGNVHEGKKIFNQRACATCHSVDGKEDLLGPDLLGVGKLLPGGGLLESIIDPNRNIKTGFDQSLITKKDGFILSGRIVTANSKSISLMVAGNKIVEIEKSEIETSELVEKSLMPEGLLSGLTDAEIKDLLGYLNSLK
ncbi:DUF7133 domain-containing protein [Flagellimonas sp. 2504JD4-2]